MSVNDPFGYEQSPYGNDADSQAFMEQLFNSPQMMNFASGIPGSSLSQKMANLKAFESLIGVPITQLLGMGSIDQPAQQVSYTRQVFGNSPYFSHAFDAIDAGNDPQTVWQEIVNNAKNYGITADPSSQEFQDWADRTYGVVKDYAFEKVKLNSDSGGDAANTFQIAGKTYKGTPDIMGTASQYDLMGAPTVESLMQEYAKTNVGNKKRFDEIQQYMAGKGRAAEGYVFEPTPEGVTPIADPNAKKDDRGWWEKAWDSTGSYMPWAQDVDGSWNRQYGTPTTTLPKPTNPDWAGTPFVDAYNPLAAAGLKEAPKNELESLKTYDPILYKALKEKMAGNIEVAKNTRVRSQANEQLMRGILAARNLLGV